MTFLTLFFFFKAYVYWGIIYIQTGEFLKEMGIPDHLTCLLRNLCTGQEATARTGHETTDWFQIRKGVYQGCILLPAYLTCMKSKS